MPTIGHWSVADLQAKLDTLTAAADGAGRAEQAALEPRVSALLGETRAELARDTKASAAAISQYEKMFGWGRRHNPLDREARSHFRAHVRPARQEVSGDERLINEVAALQERVASAANTVGTSTGTSNGYRYSARVLEISASHYEVRGTQNGHRLQFDAAHDGEQIVLRGTHDGYPLKIRITADPGGALHAEGTHGGYRFSFAAKRSAAGTTSVDGTHNGYRMAFESTPTGNGGANVTGTHNGYAVKLSIRCEQDGTAEISGTQNGYGVRAAYTGGEMSGSLNGYTVKTSTTRDVASPLGGRLVDAIALPFPLLDGDAGDALQIALWAVLSGPENESDD